MIFQTKTDNSGKEWTVASRAPIDLEKNPEDMTAMMWMDERGSICAMNFWGTIVLSLNPQTTDLLRAAELVEQTQLLAESNLA